MFCLNNNKISVGLEQIKLYHPINLPGSTIGRPLATIGITG